MFRKTVIMTNAIAADIGSAITCTYEDMLESITKYESDDYQPSGYDKVAAAILTSTFFKNHDLDVTEWYTEHGKDDAQKS